MENPIAKLTDDDMKEMERLVELLRWKYESFSRMLEAIRYSRSVLDKSQLNELSGREESQP